MTKLASSRLRADGKASFDAIYDEPTPAAYFSALRPLEYTTPGCAQPLVRRCVEALRRRLKLETVTVLDLCAGYGVNAALLRHRLTLPDLYRRFATPRARAAGAMRIIADAMWFQYRRRRDAGVRMVAQDIAGHALDYSQAVGLADAVIQVNLEAYDPAPEQAALLRDTNLIVVTGGLSYIGERTFRRVLREVQCKPWALYYPLRHTDTDAIDRTFERSDYAVETGRHTIAHRRYRSANERRAIRTRILAQAAAGEARPSPTYLEAWIKLARPEDELLCPPFDEIVATDPDRAAAGESSHADLSATDAAWG